MINDRLSQLKDYPFERLATLLRDLTPPADVRPLIMSIGEPQHACPEFVPKILAEQAALWGKYPPTPGTPEFRRTVADWLARRYQLPTDMISPDAHTLPVAGTREALFTVALAAVPTAKNGRRPVVLIPDPFYQVYAGAAIMAGAEPVFLPTNAATGFLPDFSALPTDIIDRTALAYVCSPSNPQGAVADRRYWTELLRLARDADFVVAADECYSEIYCDTPPTGVLEGCVTHDPEMDHVIAFHSLSKRSNVPGLRSGFVVGGAGLIGPFARLRGYTGGVTPLPVLATAIALWRDEHHVEANRNLYREKFDDAARILGNRFGFYRPGGGFYLWLDVGDGEAAARKLWARAGVKVMPGAYLSRAGQDAPGQAYIRAAMVHNRDQTLDALGRMTDLL